MTWRSTLTAASFRVIDKPAFVSSPTRGIAVWHWLREIHRHEWEMWRSLGQAEPIREEREAVRAVARIEMETRLQLAGIERETRRR